MIRASEPGAWRWHGAALFLYGGLSAALIWHGMPMRGMIEGEGTDPSIFLWFFAWWPWAITHHVDPIYTNLVWQPLGVSMPWVTSVPLLALLGAPFTVLGGPALTYNLIVVTAPVGAGLMAYVLCRYVTGRPAASLIGGYLFGFSSYEMGQVLTAPNLSVTLLLPALLLVSLRRLDDRIGRPATAWWGGLILVGQFLISIEIAAMMLVFGALAWTLAIACMAARRTVLRRLAVDALAASPFVAIALSPFLMAMVRHAGYLRLPPAWPDFFTADLLNIVVPSRMDWLGGALFGGISGHFNGTLHEQDAYLGLPLLVILALFARERWRAPSGRFLTLLLVCLLVASLGPFLCIGGHFTGVKLPWLIFVHLPLIGAALPGRFALFSSLGAAVCAASWVAGGRPGVPPWRLALGVLACLFLLPRPHPWFAVPESTFFQPGRVAAALGREPRLLVLPFAINGPSSAWQEESGFSFAQTGGYLGYPPAGMQHFPAVAELFGNVEEPDFLAAFSDFCLATRTQYVVAGAGTPQQLFAALARLNWPHRRIDDVDVYTVPPARAPNG